MQVLQIPAAHDMYPPPHVTYILLLGASAAHTGCAYVHAQLLPARMFACVYECVPPAHLSTMHRGITVC
jgi:hypothetical protein